MVLGVHRRLVKGLPTNMSIRLLHGGKRVQLQHVAANIVQFVVKTIQEDINPIFLEKIIISLNISRALHRIWTTKVDLTPETLQAGVVFFQGATCFVEMRYTALEIIDLGGITTIKIGGSSRVPNLFGCGKANEIAD